MSRKKILFYGPVGDKNGKIIGGGESGNLKTINILRNNNFEVEILPKPYPKKSFIRHFFPLQIFFVYVKFLFKINNFSSFHLSGFYNHLIYFEFLFIATAKIFRVNSIYEIRAGGAIESYYNGTAMYKYFFKSTLKLASSVLCQGQEYIGFVKNISEVEAFYYPNYILNSARVSYTDKNRSNEDKIHLVYFGRLAPSKNVEFIIEVCSLLDSGLFDCEFIGAGEESYIDSLKALIKSKNLENNIIISPPAKSDILFSILSEKHFFIFPSKEKREGHSNSLTEAMSRGVVPIASNAGFNATVIKNRKLIVEQFDTKVYAKMIKDIWEDKIWAKLSMEVFNVVDSNFTESVVENILKKVHS